MACVLSIEILKRYRMHWLFGLLLS